MCLDSPAIRSEGSTRCFVCHLLWLCWGVKHQADCEKEERLRTTGTNGRGFIGTLACDADLEKFPRNVNVTSTTLVQNITKMGFSGYTFK